MTTTGDEKMREELSELENWLHDNPPAKWEGRYQYVVDLFGKALAAKMLAKAALSASQPQGDVVMVPRRALPEIIDWLEMETLVFRTEGKNGNAAFAARVVALLKAALASAPQADPSDAYRCQNCKGSGMAPPAPGARVTDEMVEAAASSLMQAGYIGGMMPEDIPQNASRAARLALTAALALSPSPRLTEGEMRELAKSYLGFVWSDADYVTCQMLLAFGKAIQDRTR